MLFCITLHGSDMENGKPRPVCVGCMLKSRRDSLICARWLKRSKKKRFEHLEDEKSHADLNKIGTAAKSLRDGSL